MSIHDLQAIARRPERSQTCFGVMQSDESDCPPLRKDTSCAGNRIDLSAFNVHLDKIGRGKFIETNGADDHFTALTDVPHGLRTRESGLAGLVACRRLDRRYIHHPVKLQMSGQENKVTGVRFFACVHWRRRKALPIWYYAFALWDSTRQRLFGALLLLSCLGELAGKKTALHLMKTQE